MPVARRIDVELASFPRRIGRERPALVGDELALVRPDEIDYAVPGQDWDQCLGRRDPGSVIRGARGCDDRCDKAEQDGTKHDAGRYQS
jgi:hypothetical protein